MSRRAPTVLIIVLIAGTAIVAWLVWEAIAGNPGGPTYQAEFVNARGLLPGNNVVDDGAVVGRVTAISLARNGTALVSFQLSDAHAAPRADAVAAIEPIDLLGDNDLSLSPGSSPHRLHGPIGTNNTLDAPRLDEVLDAFTPEVRDGLEELMFEGGIALDDHGGDLARASVALRPALNAAGSVLTELDTENGSLARLVPVAEQAATQLASRRADLGPLLDELAGTLHATAEATVPLGTGLADLPATLARLRGTAAAFAVTAAAATPAAAALEPVTGRLDDVTSNLPALLGRARQAIPDLDRTLTAATTAITAGTPGFTKLASALPTVTRQAPTLSTLLQELDQAAPGIAQGFFVDFPDQADESGRQPFDPFADPTRSYWRGAAVFSCEAFGVPVAPGCMAKALANLGAIPARTPDTAKTAHPTPTTRTTPISVTTTTTPPSTASNPANPIAKTLAPILSSVGGATAPVTTKLGQTASTLLHFLLKP